MPRDESMKDSYDAELTVSPYFNLSAFFSHQPIIQAAAFSITWIAETLMQ